MVRAQLHLVYNGNDTEAYVEISAPDEAGVVQYVEIPIDRLEDLVKQLQGCLNFYLGVEK